MNKALSGFLCFGPILLYVVMVLIAVLVGVTAGGSELPVFVAILFIFLALAIVAMVYGVMIWLIIRTAKNTELETSTKVIWCLCLYVFNVLAYPVYWFKYLR